APSAWSRARRRDRGRAAAGWRAPRPAARRRWPRARWPGAPPRRTAPAGATPSALVPGRGEAVAAQDRAALGREDQPGEAAAALGVVAAGAGDQRLVDGRVQRRVDGQRLAAVRVAGQRER